MASPFPGMDPYLEGHLWPDVHSALASKIRQLLAPQVRPRYVVRWRSTWSRISPRRRDRHPLPDVERCARASRPQ